MLTKKVFPFLAVLLFYCSSSSAYDQQYTVGGVGPNGGTVTAVTVIPELTNTEEVMVGDFLETTYTYTYTETIEETVNQVSYETVTVVTEKTDQLIDTATVTNSNISTNCSWANSADFCTGNQSVGGGSKTYAFDLSDYQNKTGVDYGAKVFSHNSNANVPLCNATNNDCKDEFKVTVKLLNNGSITETYTHNYTSMNWIGSQDFSYSQDVSSLAFDSASLELYGMDSGYFSGYFGPGFSDAFFNLTYNNISEIINQIITQVEMTTIKTATEYAYDSQYIPPPPVEVDYTDYTVDAGVTFELELDTFDGGVATFEVEVTDTPTGDFEIEIVEVESFDTDLADTEVAETTEVASVEQEPVEESVNDEQNNDTTEGETKESEPVRTAKSSGDSDKTRTETGGENTDSAEKPKSSNTKGSNKGSTSVAYSTVMETVRLVTMQQSQAVKNFNEYRSITIPTTEFYTSYQIDGGNNYDNPYAEYYVGASDYLWNEMVDLQWQN
jgi:hypothetical protein